jgi:heptose I phosphotransferase
LILEPVDENSHPRWPADFVSFDEGRMRVHPDWAPRLTAAGWSTVDAVMQSSSPRVFRRTLERENAVVSWDDGAPPCYLKRHFARRPSPWLKEWRQTGRVAPAGRLEADAAAACRRAGVAVPTVVAAGWRRRGRPWQVDSFFLSEALSDRQPADRLCLRRGPWRAEAKRALLDALAEGARRLHGAGLFHRDFYWSHWFIRETPFGRFDATLIDLQRVFRPRRLASRWRLKDLAQFVFSSPQGWLTYDDLEYWFARYLGRSRLRSLDRPLLHAVRARAAVYRWREGGA